MTLKAKPKKQKKQIGKKVITGKSPAAQSLKANPNKQTKVQIIKAISEATGISTKDVKNIFTAMNDLAKSHLVKKGSGEFIIPEIGIKVVRKVKPATKQKQGRNPATGESMIIPAKPKREVIKARPLKSLRDLLENT